MRQLPSIAEMDRAFRGRDAAYDGIFLVGVKTTGIFCRPTCPARKPKPANVEFLATIQDALPAGYRPCKRCRPTDVNGSAPQWVRRLLASVEQAPEERLRDQDFRAMSIDPTRARRYFTRWTRRTLAEARGCESRSRLSGHPVFVTDTHRASKDRRSTVPCPRRMLDPLGSSSSRLPRRMRPWRKTW